MLKRANVTLDRDIILLAEAGEEGTTSVGIDFMVREHWDKIDAEFCLNEGGWILDENGKVLRRALQTVGGSEVYACIDACGVRTCDRTREHKNAKRYR